jgi:hypothetical protein
MLEGGIWTTHAYKNYNATFLNAANNRNPRFIEKQLVYEQR